MPFGAAASHSGVSSLAKSGSPWSPEKPAGPAPAITPPFPKGGANLYTTLCGENAPASGVSETSRFPCASKATPTGCWNDDPDAVVQRVCDHDVAVDVDRDPPRAVQLGRGSGPSVTAEAGRAVAGDGVDVAGGHRHAPERPVDRGDDADPVVARVADDEVA